MTTINQLTAVGSVDDEDQVALYVIAQGDTRKAPVRLLRRSYGVFTVTENGLVPAPLTPGSTRFLREDGQWIVPAGGGGAQFPPVQEVLPFSSYVVGTTTGTVQLPITFTSTRAADYLVDFWGDLEGAVTFALAATPGNVGVGGNASGVFDIVADGAAPSGYSLRLRVPSVVFTPAPTGDFIGAGAFVVRIVQIAETTPMP